MKDQGWWIDVTHFFLCLPALYSLWLYSCLLEAVIVTAPHPVLDPCTAELIPLIKRTDISVERVTVNSPSTLNVNAW
jgi:hypothetical protein